MNIRALEALVGTGRMATVTFKTDKGKVRTINGRTGVKKYTNGKGGKYNPHDKGLLTIWETLRPQDTKRDLRNKRYRMIRAENVLAVRADGVKMTVA